MIGFATPYQYMKNAGKNLEENMANDVNTTLYERGKRYGLFTGHACVTQALKREMYRSGKWVGLDDDQREALEMIAHKIGRILNGDPNYADSWHDIAGYATLVEKRLNGETV